MKRVKRLIVPNGTYMKGRSGEDQLVDHRVKAGSRRRSREDQAG